MEYGKILSSSYKADHWREMLNDIFGGKFTANPEDLSVNTQTAKQKKNK